ncbi:MAG: adenylate/guanylate cyclase domain-containing protein [Bacteroidetes bacterium]|nr:adenylate/guanylate cyclase domain-containing protein [Bacteroidota bacterium]
MDSNNLIYQDLIEKVKKLEQENHELKLSKKNSEEKFKKEQENSDALLLNILPFNTAKELKETGKSSPKYFPKASVLFTDFKDFTLNCEKLTPYELVETLHFYFKQFDEIVTKYGLEKIKTIGDSYLCVGGIPVADDQHPQRIVLAALEIQKLMNYYNEEELKVGKEAWKLRLGIHTGGLITGVVGQKKFAFDVWGDTVNIAARMESSGEVGKVNISESTYELVKDYFDVTSRGMIEVKNKGKIKMYFVDGIKPKNVMNQESFFLGRGGLGRG